MTTASSAFLRERLHRSTQRRERWLLDTGAQLAHADEMEERARVLDAEAGSLRVASDSDDCPEVFRVMALGGATKLAAQASNLWQTARATRAHVSAIMAAAERGE